MQSIGILKDLILLFAVGTGMIFAFHRLRLPPIVAFLATGVLCGPSVLGLVDDTQKIDVLAQIGVVLLLFTVGLEFSLEKIEKLKWFLIIGGGVQVAATTGVASLVMTALGWPGPEAVLFGMLASFSSMALVIRLVAERGEVDTPYGRSALAILAFQHLAVVPMVVITPILAGQKGGASLFLAGAKGVAFLALAGLASRYLIPVVFRLAVGTRRREVFMITVALLCLGTAALSDWAGLSLALGALIAGLLLSQSEYSQQALGDVAPFREVFNGFFFISVGLLVNVHFLAANAWAVLATTLGIILLKALTAGSVPLLLGHPLRVAAATGLTLAQVGGLSFVLAASGRSVGLLDAHAEQIFLSSAVVTMVLTPWLQALGSKLYRQTERPWNWSLPWRALTEAPARGSSELRDHVVVAGLDLNGRNVTKVLAGAGIPYVVVDVNPSTVAAERKRGTPVFFGDATSPETLELLGVGRARVLVVAFSDPASARRVISTAARLNPGLRVVARTRHASEVRTVLALGAKDVIPDDFETSIEISTRVLSTYLVPRAEVERYVRELRRDAYQMLREVNVCVSPSECLQDLLQEMSVATVRVAAGSSLAGKTVVEAALRSRTGATIVALGKEGTFLPNPSADEPLAPGTVAVVLGTPSQLSAAGALFSDGSTASM
jgi:monovalent cation:H+ antiporter-2, CPA2 family